MKRILTILAILTCATLRAQDVTDAQQAAAAAAQAISEAPKEEVAAPKPVYWTKSLMTNINFGQTALWNWAAGGYNNYTLAGYIDANANYAKDKMVWNNRLQLDYGFLYSQDKPILQKNKDRIYLESKWGYDTPIKHLKYSASFDFKTQFDTNWDYKTPASDGSTEPTREDWLAARSLKSALLSPAYMNLGLGVLWTPKPWLSVNFAPVTGGLVVVEDPRLRKTYGMELFDATITDPVGSDYRPVRFEFGAQLKIDAGFQINDNFSYTTQLALFYNYLTPKVEPRINWDNKVFWKLAKFFALTLSTNLIYDPLVKIDINKDGVVEEKGVQFKEFLEFGFSWTIATKAK